MIIPEIYSIPRSGGTLVYNVLNHIFDGLVKPHDHDYFETESFDTPVICVYRDFRDSLVSQYRVMTDHIDWAPDQMPGASVINNAKSQKKSIENLYMFLHYGLQHPKKKIMFLRYEDFFDSDVGDVDFEFLFDVFEKFFGLCEPQGMYDKFITEEKKQYIKKEFCFSSQKKFASNFKNFDEGFDPERTGFERMKELENSGLLAELHKRQIHGNHLNTGRKNTWKEKVPVEYHEHLNKILHRELKDWGYLDD